MKILTHLFKEWAARGIKEVYGHLPAVHVHSCGPIVDANSREVALHKPLLTVSLDQATLQIKEKKLNIIFNIVSYKDLGLRILIYFTEYRVKFLWVY